MLAIRTLATSIVRTLCLICLVCAVPSCTSAPQRGSDSLRIAMNHDPLSLDPRNVCLSKDISIVQALYEGLVREKDGELQLSLAERYTLSEDGCTYTFYLKPTLWNNNDVLTAYDFEHSVKQIYQGNIQSTSLDLLSCIKNSNAVLHHQKPLDALGIKALNTLTLEITLESPIAYFLELVARPIFYPVHQSRREAGSQVAITSYISNGPFSVKEFSPQSHLVLTKNPLYYDQQSVHLKEIVFQIVPDEHTAIQLLQKNQVDWVGAPWVSSLPIEMMNMVPSDRIFSYPVLGTAVLMYNLERFPLNNSCLRKAIAYAIDKDAILKFVPCGETAYTFVHPLLSEMEHIKKLSKEEREQLARYYLQKTREQLSQKDLEELVIIYPLGSSNLYMVVQEIQQQIKTVLDFTIGIQGMEYHCFMDKRNRGDFFLATGKWIAEYQHPVSFLKMFDKNNGGATRWRNEEYHRLISKIILCDEKKALCLAEKILDQECPIVPLYHFAYTYAINPRIKNVCPSLLGYVDLKEAYVAYNE